MNYKLKAALAVVATMLVPSVLYADAGSASGWLVATRYDAGTAEVTGVTDSWAPLTVRHVPSTQNRFIGDPNVFPPGACRSIAIKWNVGLFTNQPRRFFLRQLDLAAKFNCKIDFVTDMTPNADQSHDLLAVAPAP